jgi:hypothetical protein
MIDNEECQLFSLLLSYFILRSCGFYFLARGYGETKPRPFCRYERDVLPVSRGMGPTYPRARAHAPL